MILTDEEAVEMVQTYRTKYKEVPGFWDGLEEAAVMTSVQGDVYAVIAVPVTAEEKKRNVGKVAALAAPYAVHGCTTGRWSGKGTAKENRPRSIT